MTRNVLRASRERERRLAAFEKGLEAVRRTPKEDRILILGDDNRLRFVTSRQEVDAALGRARKAQGAG